MSAYSTFLRKVWNKMLFSVSVNSGLRLFELCWNSDNTLKAKTHSVLEWNPSRHFDLTGVVFCLFLYESSWLQYGNNLQWCFIVSWGDAVNQIRLSLFQANSYILMFGTSGTKRQSVKKKGTEWFGHTELNFAHELELRITGNGVGQTWITNLITVPIYLTFKLGGKTQI